MTLASQTVVPLDDQTLVRCIHSDCSATIVKNIVRRRLRGSVPPACHLDNTQTSFVSYMLELRTSRMASAQKIYRHEVSSSSSSFYYTVKDVKVIRSTAFEFSHFFLVCGNHRP